MAMTGLKRFLQKKKKPGVLELPSHMPTQEIPMMESHEEVTEERPPVSQAPSILDLHLERLGMNSEESKEALKNFAELVYAIESDKNPKAINKETSASGGFQFTRSAIRTALSRMEDVTEGEMPAWARDLKNVYDTEDISKDRHRQIITSLPYEFQRSLFFADILEKTIEYPGYGDELIGRIINGDTEAMKEMYYKGHHTKPDDNTRKRVERIIRDGDERRNASVHEEAEREIRPSA